MSGRDFETEFDEIMVGLARYDQDLVDSIKDNLAFGSGEDGSDHICIRGTQVERNLRLHYLLNDERYAHVVSKCVSELAGVKLGSEVFRE